MVEADPSSEGSKEDSDQTDDGMLSSVLGGGDRRGALVTVAGAPLPSEAGAGVCLARTVWTEAGLFGFRGIFKGVAKFTLIGEGEGAGIGAGEGVGAGAGAGDGAGAGARVCSGVWIGVLVGPRG